MSCPLQLLFVGVSQADVERLSQPLLADGFAPHSLCVADADEVIEGASNSTQILVVAVQASDVTLLDRVVAVLRQRMLDIPVLAYAADGFHENIVDAMRAGAQDFITAKHVARILPAVRRELINVQMRAEQKEQIVSDYLLSEIDQLILRGMEVAPLVQRVCARMFELFELKLVWIGSKRPGGEVAVLASAGEAEYLDGIDVRWDDSPKGCGATGKAIKSHQPQLLLVDEADFAPWREQAKRFGIASVLALPMVTRGDVIGTLMLYSMRSHAFGEAAIKRFQAFADRLAVGLLACQEQQQSRLLSAAMNAANNAMFITERDGTIVWFNQALNLFSGYSSADILNCNPRMFSSGEHDSEFWREMWEILSQGKPWRNEVLNRRKDGHTYTVMQTITPLYDDAGELTHFLAIQQDITEKKELEREIEYLAYHDMLTGLPNRVLFQDRLQLTISQAKREQNEFSLLFIDLDGFKEVNDVHGHAAGDRLLQIIAQRLRSCVREADSVARLGGDEFTILLRGIAEKNALERLLNKIIDAVSQPCVLGEYSANVTASIGVSRYPQDATGVEKLLIRADEAMYRAKQAGKNRFALYSDVS